MPDIDKLLKIHNAKYQEKRKMKYAVFFTHIYYFDFVVQSRKLMQKIPHFYGDVNDAY